MKICSKCHESKNITEFLNSKSQNLNICKLCAKQRWKWKNLEFRREYYKLNKDRINALKRDCRIKNIEQYMLLAAKKRARNNGLAFNLDIADIIIPTHCPILNIPLIISDGTSDNSPSLDRIDNTKGYIKGNVIVISYRANRLKADATLNELWLVYDKYRKIMANKYIPENYEV